MKDRPSFGAKKPVVQMTRGQIAEAVVANNSAKRLKTHVKHSVRQETEGDMHAVKSTAVTATPIVLNYVITPESSSSIITLANPGSKTDFCFTKSRA